MLIDFRDFHPIHQMICRVMFPLTTLEIIQEGGAQSPSLYSTTVAPSTLNWGSLAMRTI